MFILIYLFSLRRSSGQHPVPGCLLCDMYQRGSAGWALSHCWLLIWCLCGIWNLLSASDPESTGGVSLSVWWLTLLCGSIHSGWRQDHTNTHTYIHTHTLKFFLLQMNFICYLFFRHTEPSWPQAKSLRLKLKHCVLSFSSSLALSTTRYNKPLRRGHTKLKQVSIHWKRTERRL